MAVAIMNGRESIDILFSSLEIPQMCTPNLFIEADAHEWWRIIRSETILHITAH